MVRKNVDYFNEHFCKFVVTKYSNSAVNIIDTYFGSPGDFKNRFFAPASDEELADAQDVLQIKFPTDLIEFFKISNGFEGFIDDYYLRLIPAGYMYDSTLDYCSTSFPWAVYLGTNAGGEMVVIDTRETPYQFGMLPYLGTDEDFIPLGDTFGEFIRRVYDDEIFD
jgi:SMI1/KNR4 family protein SUKH-1